MSILVIDHNWIGSKIYVKSIERNVTIERGREEEYAALGLSQIFVRTTPKAPAKPADVNSDGVVDETDLSIVHKEYHKDKKEGKKQAPKKSTSTKKRTTKKKPDAEVSEGNG